MCQIVLACLGCKMTEGVKGVMSAAGLSRSGELVSEHPVISAWELAVIICAQ